MKIIDIEKSCEVKPGAVLIVQRPVWEKNGAEAWVGRRGSLGTIIFYRSNNEMADILENEFPGLEVAVRQKIN